MCVFFQQLEESLVAFGEKWELNPQDGAFYGPKVGLGFSAVSTGSSRVQYCPVVRVSTSCTLDLRSIPLSEPEGFSINISDAEISIIKMY